LSEDRGKQGRGKLKTVCGMKPPGAWNLVRRKGGRPERPGDLGRGRSTGEGTKINERTARGNGSGEKKGSRMKKGQLYKGGGARKKIKVSLVTLEGGEGAMGEKTSTSQKRKRLFGGKIAGIEG